jgi:hypothetical protein
MNPSPPYGALYVIRKSYLVCSAGLLLAIAACDQSTGPSGGISQTAANQLALGMDAMFAFSASDFGLGSSFSVSAGGAGSSSAAVLVPIKNTFSVTKQCPKGGHLAVAGTAIGTGDPATHSLSLQATATRTDTDCAFQTDDGVVTLNGSIDYKANLNIVNGAPVGLQTQTHEGTFTASRPGASITCDVDLASSFNPDTHTVTVTGTFCGKQINVTRTRPS